MRLWEKGRRVYDNVRKFVLYIFAHTVARSLSGSLRSVGVFSNPLLLRGIAFELAFTALLVVFGTAGLTPEVLAFIVPFPFIVWGVDELRRRGLRHRERPCRMRDRKDVTRKPAGWA